MIDEDLYTEATDELNSDRKNATIWTRACALASDDHDEARYLYINLRVEQMAEERSRSVLGDSKNAQDTKSTLDASAKDAASADTKVALSSQPTMNSDELSLVGDDDDSDKMISSVRTGSDSSKQISALALDDMIDLSNADSGFVGSVSSSGDKPSGTESFELDPEEIARDNATRSGAVSPYAANKQSSSSMVLDNEVDTLLSDEAASQSPPPPETVKTRALADDLERQVNDMSSTEIISADDTANNGLAINSIDSNPAEVGVRPDYSDGELLLDDPTNGAEAALYDGFGPSFMVFTRDGIAKATKQGVSWPAMLFTLPWLLYKQLIGTAIVYICMWIAVVAGFVASALHWLDMGQDASTAIKLWTLGFAVLGLIGLFYIPFRYGNSWAANKLQDRGFVYQSRVSASSRKHAITRLKQFAEQ